MELHHIVLTSARGRRLPLWTSEGDYLAALHRIGRTSRGSLALFALIAEHVHLLALLTRAAAGRLAQAALLSLAPTVATPLAPSYIEPVKTRSHLRWLLTYFLEQPTKHEMPGHAALWVGSCLPELVGARALPGLTLQTQAALPDLSPRKALAIVGLPARDLVLPDRASIKRAGVRRIAHASAAAYGELPPLCRNTPAARQARRTAVQLSYRVGLRARDIAEGMALAPKTVWSLRQRRMPTEALLTVVHRLALEDLVARHGGIGEVASHGQRFTRQKQVENRR